jgi:hypothetical protein
MQLARERIAREKRLASMKKEVPEPVKEEEPKVDHDALKK